MTEPFLGEIAMFGGNFAIIGWAQCAGQLVSIAQNNALFALLGTTYGGDGVNTFGLPDFRGRVGLSAGQGPGLQNYTQGQISGSENVTITNATMPFHQHFAMVNLVDGVVDAPAATVMPAKPKQVAGGQSATLYTDPTKTPVAGDLKPFQNNTIIAQGGSQPHNNLMPYLTITFLIAMEGIFPSRN